MAKCSTVCDVDCFPARWRMFIWEARGEGCCKRLHDGERVHTHHFWRQNSFGLAQHPPTNHTTKRHPKPLQIDNHDITRLEHCMLLPISGASRRRGLCSSISTEKWSCIDMHCSQLVGREECRASSSLRG